MININIKGESGENQTKTNYWFIAVISTIWVVKDSICYPSLTWPDPFHTGAYRLEIISAALIISNQ